MIGRVLLSVGKGIAALFAIFLACDTVLNQIAGQVVDSKRVLSLSGIPVTISLAVVLASVFISFVVYAFKEAVGLKYRADVRRFFGVDHTFEVLFVIPSYRCLGTEGVSAKGFGHDAFHDQGVDMFFKRDSEGGIILKKPFQSPICLSTDVAAYFFASRALGPEGLKFHFEIDENVVRPPRLALAAEYKQKCLISFGSGSSNYLAKFLEKFAFFQSDASTYSFVGTDALVRNQSGLKRPSKRNPLSYLKSDPGTDYAVVARYAEEGQVFFLCAGIDQAGSIAATQILLNQWRVLLKETHGGDFFYIYSIDRKHLRPEALYEEKVAARPIYRHSSKGKASVPSLPPISSSHAPLHTP